MIEEVARGEGSITIIRAGISRGGEITTEGMREGITTGIGTTIETGMTVETTTTEERTEEPMTEIEGEITTGMKEMRITIEGGTTMVATIVVGEIITVATEIVLLNLILDRQEDPEDYRRGAPRSRGNNNNRGSTGGDYRREHLNRNVEEDRGDRRPTRVRRYEDD